MLWTHAFQGISKQTLRKLQQKRKENQDNNSFIFIWNRRNESYVVLIQVLVQQLVGMHRVSCSYVDRSLSNHSLNANVVKSDRHRVQP